MTVLAEVAVQLKTSLSFLLGLAGMFAILRAGFTAAIGMPEAPSGRATLELDIARLRKRIWVVVAVTFLLFAGAVLLYLGPIAGIDAEAVRSGTALTPRQACAIVALILISLAILGLDTLATIWRRVLGEKVAAAKQTG